MGGLDDLIRSERCSNPPHATFFLLRLSNNLWPPEFNSLATRNMSEEQFTKLLERKRNRPLKPEEQSALDELFALDPVLRERWDLEMELDELIVGVDEPVVSSNFTSLTFAAATKLGPRQRSFSIRLGALWKTSLGRATSMATLGVALTLGVFTYFQNAERAQLSKVLIEMSDAIAATQPLTTATAVDSEVNELLSNPDEPLNALTEFQTIRKMGSIPAENDASLLAALQ